MRVLVYVVCMLSMSFLFVEEAISQINAQEGKKIEINSVTTEQLNLFLDGYFADNINTEIELSPQLAQEIINDRNTFGSYKDEEDFKIRTVPIILTPEMFIELQELIAVEPPLFNTRLIIARHSGKCLDVSLGPNQDNVQIIQSTCHGGPNQRFMLIPFPNRQYQIRAEHSNKCFEIEAGSQDDGALLKQYACQEGSSHQRFWLNDIASGFYLMQAGHSGKCLSVKDWSFDDNAPVQQEACFGGDNQQWEIK